jgi:hypothetical protein
LQQLDAIAAHRGQIVGELRGHRHVMFLESRRRQDQDFTHHGVDVER